MVDNLKCPSYQIGMSKLKSERHHWWPECVSKYWADDGGGLHWLLPSLEVRRSTPSNFGVIGNGHHIKLGDDPEIGSVWDESYEAEFSTADGNFPGIIDWLDSLNRCDPPFEALIAKRIQHQTVQDGQFRLLIECLVSLAARSPMQREKSVSLAEHFSGPLPEQKRNSLIGANSRHSLRNAVRGLGGSGKAMAIFSPEREFIFGDGFFHNLTINGEHWNHPKMLVPLTPWLCVLFVRPIGYRTEPKLVTLVASSQETNALNFAAKVYARNALFFRSEKPDVGDEFTCGRHKIFADHRNSVDDFIHHIPGVPPRDPSLDFIADFLAETSRK